MFCFDIVSLIFAQKNEYLTMSGIKDNAGSII